MALFIVCEWCEKSKKVRKPCEHVGPRRRRFCSRNCASTATFNREAASRGWTTRARNQKRKVLERVVGLTPLEAFRLGYTRGLQSKHRQLRRFRREAV